MERNKKRKRKKEKRTDERTLKTNKQIHTPFTLGALRRQSRPSPVNEHKELWRTVETRRQTADFVLISELKFSGMDGNVEDVVLYVHMFKSLGHVAALSSLSLSLSALAPISVSRYNNSLISLSLSLSLLVSLSACGSATLFTHMCLCLFVTQCICIWGRRASEGDYRIFAILYRTVCVCVCVKSGRALT